MCCLGFLGGGFFSTEAFSDSSIACLHFVLNQEAVLRIFNHSLDGATSLPSRPNKEQTLPNSFPLFLRPY